MILTCPDCATRYFVEDRRLGPNGRTVRCASCGITWRALREEPLELSLAPDEGAVARGAEDPLSFLPAEPEPPPPPPSEVSKAFRAKAEQRRKAREAATAGVVWASLATAFLVVLGAAWLFRVDLVRLYPRAAGAYASLGIPVNPTGLEFKDVKARPAASEPGKVYITGEVRNVERRAAEAPPLRVTLIGKNGVKLVAKVMSLPTGDLRPGQAESFSLMLADPRAEAVDVDVGFALDLFKPRPRRPRPRPALVARTPVATTPSRPPAPAPKPALAPAAPPPTAPSLRPLLDVAAPVSRQLPLRGAEPASGRP
jgi:predicted Zn finger-like uncharacterized protein